MNVMRPVLSFNPPPINHTELARHLAVERSSLPQIVGQFGLTQASGRYPWHRIWRTIHRIEGTLLAGHLEHLRRLHASPTIDDIDDIAIALTVPLMTFSEMAQALGSKLDTPSSANQLRPSSQASFQRKQFQRGRFVPRNIPLQRSQCAKNYATP